MIKDNRFSNYFIYAIGEIILVVIGILIALQINNWNEDRKLQHKKQELVDNLLSDFQLTFVDLETSLKRTDSLIVQMDTFAEMINSNSQVSVDSLKTLARAFFRQEPYISGLSSYKQAVNNGNLELFSNPALIGHFNRFEERDNLQQLIFNNFLQAYSNGYLWDLRKEVGSIYTIYRGSSSSFTGMAQDTLNLESYRKLILSPTILAAMQNHRQLTWSRRGDLVWLMEIAEKILGLLEEEKNK